MALMTRIRRSALRRCCLRTATSRAVRALSRASRLVISWLHSVRFWVLLPLPGFVSTGLTVTLRWARTLPLGGLTGSGFASAAPLSADLRQGSSHLLRAQTAGLYRSKDA